MDETKLAIRESMTLQETMTLGDVLAKSGFFNDAKDAAKAVVKVLAGRELGFGPIASMTGVHVVQGKPSIGANLLGAAIKGSGRYNYRVAHLDDTRAEVVFFEHGQEAGRSSFTMDDAKKAGLSGKDNWQKYPRNMLFSRALSNGARWYCPDVFSGVTPYTPEELGAEVDGETGDVIDVTPTPITPKAEKEQAAAQREQKQPERPKPTNGNARPFNAETVRDKVRQLAGWQNDQRWLDGEPLTDETDGLAANLLWTACKPAQGIASKDEMANRVTLILRYLLGVDDVAQLYEKEAAAIIHWLANAEGTDLNNYAITEAAVVYGAAMAEGDDAGAPF